MFFKISICYLFYIILNLINFSELLSWVQYQQSLENQLDAPFSDAETVSLQDDSSQYWSINNDYDYAIS